MPDSLWSELYIEIPLASAELVAQILEEEGSGGVVVDDPEIAQQLALQQDEYFGSEVPATLPQQFGLRAYFPVDDRLGERLERLRARIGELLGREPQFQLRRIKEQDWAAAWKKYFKPERIGRVVIKPSWEAYQPQGDEVIVELDPGMAFGTGTHPTTRACIELLPELITPVTRVLDLGTGSGILSLVAAKLGAQQVLASDIDPLAVRVARENITRNRLQQQIKVIEGDLLQLELGERFDLVVANIIAKAILQIIPDLNKVLAERGVFLASGIIAERLPEIEAALGVHGFQITKKLRRDGWVALLAGRT